MAREIVMLGTGSAMPVSNYHACFIVKDESFTLLSDAGGGNGILTQLNAAKISPAEITHFILSHSHSDHILGAVWLIRVLIQNYLSGQRFDKLKVYANRQTAEALVEICRLTFLDSYFSKFDTVIDLKIVDTPASTTIGTQTINFFDVGSENVQQMGFRIKFDDNTTLVSLGDEALTAKNSPEVKDDDYLICGAFCRYADRDIFKPYEKHHFTVKDVAQCANTSNIRNLILYHSEDRTDDKRNKYTIEAKEYFNGNVIIPYDLDRIQL